MNKARVHGQRASWRRVVYPNEAEHARARTWNPWLGLASRSPCCNDKRYNICLHTDVINLINLIKKIIFEWIVKLIIIVLAILILK